VLRGIFGSMRNELTGVWRTLHNEELRNLYSLESTIKIMNSRRMRWAGHVARMGKRGTHIHYSGKTRRKETTRKTKMLVDGYVKMDLGEIGGVIRTRLV
jgi:hypothetical protein